MSRERDLNINRDYDPSIKQEEGSHRGREHSQEYRESHTTNTRLEAHEPIHDASTLYQHGDDSGQSRQMPTYQSTTLDRIYQEAWPLAYNPSSSELSSHNTSSVRSHHHYDQQYPPDAAPSSQVYSEENYNMPQHRHNQRNQQQPHHRHSQQQQYQYQYYRPHPQSYDEQDSQRTYHEHQNSYHQYPQHPQHPQQHPQHPQQQRHQHQQYYHQYSPSYYQYQQAHSYASRAQPTSTTSTARRAPSLPTSSRVNKTQYIKDYQKNDVLCGRGGATNSHVGNIYYRNLVKDNKDRYLKAKKKEKPEVAADVVKMIRQLDPPGRFLKKDKGVNCWVDIGDVRAKEKTSQALREGAPLIRKMLNISSDGDESGDLLKTATSSEDPSINPKLSESKDEETDRKIASISSKETDEPPSDDVQLWQQPPPESTIATNKEMCTSDLAEDPTRNEEEELPKEDSPSRESFEEKPLKDDPPKNEPPKEDTNDKSASSQGTVKSPSSTNDDKKIQSPEDDNISKEGSLAEPTSEDEDDLITKIPRKSSSPMLPTNSPPIPSSPLLPPHSSSTYAEKSESQDTMKKDSLFPTNSPPIPSIPSSPLLPPHRSLKSSGKLDRDDGYDSDDYVPFPKFADANDEDNPSTKKRAIGRRPEPLSDEPLRGGIGFSSPLTKRKMATVDTTHLDKQQRELYSIFDPPSSTTHKETRKAATEEEESKEEVNNESKKDEDVEGKDDLIYF